ncbi:SNF2_N domain-containing protein [Meloidogyne graminicola]|uniref:SNF2_N domain-containing protein n=1 Tax=Meloidogyne graminicola TaxID=189291 RepID=A0A8S9Z6J1_9BILA|nr:SNF2_N domain-containing protein [Meloidogyne graminicola]
MFLYYIYLNLFKEFLLRLDFYGVVFPVITDRQLRLSIVREKISSNIPCIILLLSNSNPAVRFRIRAASAYAFRHFVTLLPLENKQKHFLHELFENSETDKQSTMMMQTTYLNSFSLVDVLGCPGNLPKLKREDIPFLVDTLNLRTYQLEEWKSYFSSSQIYIEKLTDCKERHSVISNGNRERILVISYEELRSNKVLCIRNPSSQLFENICALKSAHRLILSGTPVQNSPADLWALFTYLSSRAAFHSKFMRPIMACRSQRSSEQQIKDGEQALQSLHKQCLPFILRRLKAEVLTELPEKIVQDRECELSLLQRHLYKLIVEFCSLNVRGAGGGGKSHFLIQIIFGLYNND